MNLEFTDTNVSLSLNIGFGYVQNTVKNGRTKSVITNVLFPFIKITTVDIYRL